MTMMLVSPAPEPLLPAESEQGGQLCGCSPRWLPRWPTACGFTGASTSPERCARGLAVLAGLRSFQALYQPLSSGRSRKSEEGGLRTQGQTHLPG